MDVIQSLSLIVLLSMLIYLVFVNIFTTKTVQTSGSVVELLAAPPAPSVSGVAAAVGVPAGSAPLVSNKLPAAGPDASVHPQSSIFSSTAASANDVNALNQDIYEKQADFGSDVTNINQFYKNNPEVFSKILGQTAVTNVADWERQSKELFDSAQSAPAGPIQAANFESNFNLSSL